MDLKDNIELELIPVGIAKEWTDENVSALADQIKYYGELMFEYGQDSQHSYTEQKWVSVKDGLPENRHWVLVMSSSELFLANYKHGLFYNGPEVLYKPTHWMPLPKPPTEQ